MIIDNFYPTATTIDLTTNEVELTDNVVANYGGDLSAYWMGYIESDDIPDFFKPRVLTCFPNSSSVLKIQKYDVPTADFGYVQKNSSTRGLNFNYTLNSTPVTGTTYYNAINAMSPLNAPVITLSGGFRIALYISMCYFFVGDSHYKLASEQIHFTSITDFLDFMHGDTTVNITFSMTDSSVSPAVTYSHTINDLSVSDIDGKFLSDFEVIGGANSAHYSISITGFNYNHSNRWYQNDGIATTRTDCYVSPAVKISTGTFEYLYCNYGISMIINVPFRNSGTPSTSYIITEPSVTNVGGSSWYGNNGIYFMCPVYDDNDIDFLDFIDDPTAINFLNSGAIIYDNPNISGSFKIVPSLKAKDILMYFALYPSLSGASVGDIYLPLFDGNKLTGDFFPLDELADKGADFQKDDDISKNDYTEDDKPSGGEGDGTDDYDRGDGTNLPAVSSLRFVTGNGFTKFYLLGTTELSDIKSLLSAMPSTFWEALGTATDYKMSNLFDYIASLKWYPIPILEGATSLFPDTQTNDIQVGFSSNSVIHFLGTPYCYNLGTVNRLYHMGAITIPYKVAGKESFLDYEPYTSVTAVLPYIGNIQLNCNDVLNRTINCYYIIDLTTGMCTCILDNQFYIIAVASGKIGVDLSISGNDVITQSEKIASAYISAGSHAVNNGISLVTSALSGNIAGGISGAVSTVTDIASDAVSIANAKRGVPRVIGSGSGFGSTYTSQTPCIQVCRPNVKIPDNYGHTQGYVTSTTQKISALSGFTVVDNPDLTSVKTNSAGYPLTREETDLLYNILTTGFYA